MLAVSKNRTKCVGGCKAAVQSVLTCNENFGTVPKMKWGSNFILQNLENKAISIKNPVPGCRGFKFMGR